MPEQQNVTQSQKQREAQPTPDETSKTQKKTKEDMSDETDEGSCGTGACDTGSCG